MAGCGVSRGGGLLEGDGELINHEVSTRDVCHIRLHLGPRPQICMLFHDIVPRHTTQLRSTVAVLCDITDSVYHIKSVDVNTLQVQLYY